MSVLKQGLWSLALLAGMAYAAEEEASSEASIVGSTSGNIAITSNYIFRGLTQTNHWPAAQAGLDWNHPTGAYLGVWGSNVHFPTSSQNISLELDFSGGYTYSFNEDFNLGLGIQYYSYYPNGSLDMWEFPLKAGWKTIKLGVAYSPRWNGVPDSQSWYLSAGWSDTVFAGFGLGLTAGYSVFAPTAALADYADFKVSIYREIVGINFDLSATFTDKQRPVFEGSDGTRLIFTAAKTL